MRVNDKKIMEYEKRVMIDENQYLSVKDFFYKSKYKYHEIVNENLYFDNESHYIILHDMMLRIRIINGTPKEVTLKVKGDNGDQEITRIIKKKIDLSKSLFEQDLLNESMIRIFKKHNINPQNIRLITSLTTYRMEVFADNCLYVIDKNIYNGITDYDIEVESSSIDLAEKYLLELISKFNIEYKKDYVTKSRRAINSIK